MGWWLRAEQMCGKYQGDSYVSKILRVERTLGIWPTLKINKIILYFSDKIMIFNMCLMNKIPYLREKHF